MVGDFSPLLITGWLIGSVDVVLGEHLWPPSFQVMDYKGMFGNVILVMLFVFFKNMCEKKKCRNTCNIV